MAAVPTTGDGQWRPAPSVSPHPLLNASQLTLQKHQRGGSGPPSTWGLNVLWSPCPASLGASHPTRSRQSCCGCPRFTCTWGAWWHWAPSSYTAQARPPWGLTAWGHQAGGWLSEEDTAGRRGSALRVPRSCRREVGTLPCRSDCRQTARDGIPTGSSSHSTEKWSYLRPRGGGSARRPRPPGGCSMASAARGL